MNFGRVRDPFVGSMLVLSALVAMGLISVALAWKGLADSLVVAVQLPYAVSGAMGGIALVGFGLGLIAIQATRRAEARERALMNEVVTAAADVLAAARQGQ